MRLSRIATLVLLGAAGMAVGCASSSASGWPPKPAEKSSFALFSEAFGDGQPIERVYATAAAGGDNTSPPLEWSDPPPDTRSYAIEVVDLSPVANEWVHWLVVDIPAGEALLLQGASQRGLPGVSKQLTNGFGYSGWGGPQPPPGSGRHDYRFTVIALDTPTLGLSAGSSLKQFRAAASEHALDSASMVGTFER
jgi:Raf kinase inhibitor-like YbhB/YbcL family protein